MFKKLTIKKLTLCAVALMMCLATVLTACGSTDTYTPNLTMPASKQVTSNGGPAVLCGEYIYYVNGYQSSSSVEPTYVKPATLGNIVRVKKADIDAIFAELALNKDGVTTTTIASDVADAMREKAELVSTDVVYSAFSASSSATTTAGLYIFGDYIYYTTPNQHLAANGSKLTTQLVLKRCKLDGTASEELVVLENNSATMQFVEKDGAVYAIYVDGDALYCVEAKADAKATEVSTGVSTPYFDGANVYYMADGKIMYYTLGSEAKEMKVEPAVKDENVEYTYTVKAVNNGYVYYTYTASPSEFAFNKVYYTTADENVNGVAYESTTDLSTLYFYKTNAIKVISATAQGKTVYGIELRDSQGTVTKTLIDERNNDKTITINKIEGNSLIYTMDSVTYKQNLDNLESSAEAIAYSLGTTNTGWAMPDMVGEYVFTISSSAVNVVKFDAEKKANQKLASGSVVTINIVLGAEK